MTRIDFVFDEPERVVVGTVGQPGERAFYLQARQGSRVCSVLMEKQQAALLADALEEMLADAGIADLAGAPTELADVKPLDVPLSEEFRVARLGLGWQPARQRIRVEAASADSDGDDLDDDDSEVGDDDGSAAEPLQVLTVYITASYAREFIRRTRAVVAAGRRACPVCEQPLDPQGHVCPRANGYHRLERR